MVARGLKRLGDRDDLTVERIRSNMVLVTSRQALPPRELVELGFDLRHLWFAGEGSVRVDRVLHQEARALAGDCPNSE